MRTLTALTQVVNVCRGYTDMSKIYIFNTSYQQDVTFFLKNSGLTFQTNTPAAFRSLLFRAAGLFISSLPLFLLRAPACCSEEFNQDSTEAGRSSAANLARPLTAPGRNYNSG